jgi:cell division protein FtsB
MAYSNRKAVYPESAPGAFELHPIPERRPRTRTLQSRQRKRMTRGEALFYLGVNIALIFGVLQCVRTFVGDSLNLSRLWHSKASVQTFHQQTQRENKQLQAKIKMYSSPSGIEELARNYLNMVGENELPVRFQ